MNDLTVKVFNYLPIEAKEIRLSVFVKEQGFNEEFDEIDDIAYHFVLYKKDMAIATARVFYYEEDRYYKLGRFAVVEKYRYQGLGLYLYQKVEEFLLKEKGHVTIGLSSQQRAIEFYKKCGFKEEGEMYLEEGYPHLHMSKTI